MIKQVALRISVVLAFLVALVGVQPTAAFAQPGNDDFADATSIGDLPFETTQDTSSASTETTDPEECHNNESVWFAFTPSTDVLIQASTAGSDYSTVLSVWTGTAGSLTLEACNEEYDEESRVTFVATGGTTYYFMVASYFAAEAGELNFSVAEVARPENDTLAAAEAIDELPFSSVLDLDSASLEDGETSACVRTKKTVWYSFTPDTTGSVTARIGYWGGVAAYRGTSLVDLTPMGCSSRSNVPFTFRAEAGTTYLFQVGQRCCTSEQSTGSVEFDLTVAPNPQTDVFFSPTDPSTLAPVSFRDHSFDPGMVDFATRVWDFGDGTTFDGPSPSHQYAADGDYLVRLTVTTIDGRTATTTRVVPVRTHDVAVTRVVVPAVAWAGRTIKVRVQVRNTRLPETVRVDLNRSVPGGFGQVGSLTQAVPVSSDGKTTGFTFSYVVTDADRAAGTITFRADAVLAGARDAIPADNSVLSRAFRVF